MLTLQDSVERALRYNLGSLSAGDTSKMARAQRLAAVAQLLPDITGNVHETVQQINLAAEGLRINVPIPGFHFPTIVGPFNYFDARASLSEGISLTAVRNARSSRESERATQLSVKDSRELVTLAVAGSYLQMNAAAARIQTANARYKLPRRCISRR